MPSRRSALALLGAALGGCVGRDHPGTASETDSDDPATDTSTGVSNGQSEPSDVDPGTPDDWPPDEWAPAWSVDVSENHVLGIDVDDDRLLVTANSNDRSTVFALDPVSRERYWSTELGGRALSRSIPDPNHARGWGVTVVDDAVLVATEREPGRPPTVLHGLGRSTGERRWSLERDEQLMVRSVVDGTAYVHGQYVSETPTTHAHYGSESPSPTPKPSSVYAVDVADGSVRWSTTRDGIRHLAAGASGVYLAVMNRLVAFDHAGTERWTIAADHLSRDLLVADGGLFFVTMPDWARSVVRRVEAEGTERWTEQVRADETTVHDGALYAAGRGVWRFGRDGLEWETPVYAGWPTFGPDDGSLYLRTGRQADAVSALSTDDGAREWAFDPPLSNAWAECATANAVVAGGIGDAGQPLYRVDADSGIPTGQHLGVDPLVVAPYGETVLVGGGSHEVGGGRLLAFDA